MKEKTVKLGEKDVKLSTSAYLVILYQDLFNRNLFEDMGRIVDEALNGKSIPYAELLTLYKLCYAMAKHADPQIEPFNDWLHAIDIFDIPMIAEDLVNLWLDETKTMSTP